MWEKTEECCDLQGEPKIGKKLREARERLRMSGEAAANAAGLSSAQTLYGYEKDRREPDFSALIRLCNTLGETPNSLFSFPDFNRALMADVMVAVDEFMAANRRKVDPGVKAQLCFAVYDALEAEPDKLRDHNGRLNLSELMGLMRLAL
ncbi:MULTISPECIES: helix-turn-helix domain-containing protein [Thalassospira]|nr:MULTISPECIES: helix-turn-helix transcriptional regulator [Thalassospira]